MHSVHFVHIRYIKVYMNSGLILILWFWQLRQQVSIHTLAVIGRGCLAGSAGGWCPSTIVLHIFLGFKCTFSFTLLYFQILQWLQTRQNVKDALTRPILSATCVGTSQLLHSVEPSLPSSEPHTFTILTVKLVIRTMRAWEAFKSLCSGFLVNTRVPDYQACIEKLLKSYEDISSRKTLEQWVMSMEKDSTKTLRRWTETIKVNGTPAWWETSAGCSCVTSRRQNTPDLLRKHTLTVCGTMNCVIVSSKYIDLISVLYLSCYICYHIYPTPPLGQDMTQGQFLRGV